MEEVFEKDAFLREGEAIMEGIAKAEEQIAKHLQEEAVAKPESKGKLGTAKEETEATVKTPARRGRPPKNGSTPKQSGSKRGTAKKTEETMVSVPEQVELPATENEIWVCNACGTRNRSKFCTGCGISKSENAICSKVETLENVERDTKKAEEAEQLREKILESDKRIETLELEQKRLRYLMWVLTGIMILAFLGSIICFGIGLRGDQMGLTETYRQVEPVCEVVTDINETEHGSAANSSALFSWNATKTSDLLREDMELLDAYMELNKDVVALVSIEGTVLNHPVVQTVEDEQFYLRRDLNKNHNSHGVPFLSADSQLDTPSRNVVIYGHNICKNQRDVFADLCYYEDATFFKEHPWVKVVTKSGVSWYQVFAYFEIDTASDDFLYDRVTSFISEEELQTYVEQIKLYSIQFEEIETGIKDSLLTLSSCANRNNADRTRRMVLCARKEGMK